MRIRLINGHSDSAPYESILLALGHNVTVVGIDDCDSSISDKADISIWNFSADSNDLEGDFTRFSSQLKSSLLPTLAIIPRTNDFLEHAAHTSGVDYVLRQPTSIDDLLVSLARTTFEDKSSFVSKKSLPLLLVVGADEGSIKLFSGAHLHSAVICIYCPSPLLAITRCEQLKFDAVVICEDAGSLLFNQYVSQLKPICSDAGLIGFAETSGKNEEPLDKSGVTWVNKESGSRQLLRVIGEVLDHRSRVARRKELDVEIVSKQQELQRVNAMLRTINKAFRDTNIRLEREGHTKDQMIGVAAHELKSPLAAMAGALGVLCEDICKFDQEDQQMLTLMQRNNDRMIKLVENVLDLSRVEAGRISLNPIHCHPVTLIEQAIETVALRARKKGVRFDILDSPGLDDWFVDAHTLSQMLVNLLDNAVKFSPKDGRINVIVRSVASEIHFVVADEGPGIPVEDRSLVFERFHHRSRGDDVHSAGSGLGLTITKALAEFLGGRVTVGESPQGGALFTISLPLVQDAQMA